MVKSLAEYESSLLGWVVAVGTQLMIPEQILQVGRPAGVMEAGQPSSEKIEELQARPYQVERLVKCRIFLYIAII